MRTSRPSTRGACRLALGALLACAATLASATPFSLPPLPYATDALAPAMDARTLEIHHGRHHKTYVDNLNAKAAEFPALASQSLEDIQKTISRYDDAVRNNAGGHYNHSLFWTLLAPKGQGGAPSPELRSSIEQAFGNLETFKARFDDAAKRVFGSGWAWVIVQADGSLAITTTANQDNPLMDTVQTRGHPILGLDVWEHAYYLGYQNRRSDYVSAFWGILNWETVNRNFAEATVD